MEEYETKNVGNPSISELIKILEEIKDDIGDVKVCGAYDGNWNTKVIIKNLGDRITIGSIS